ncbi:MAG: YdcF family protein [Coleofasciculaceae cyanobacterium SM2_3_26]|nr:YdcF family protein [Coleofasciculaceae cyanobacterium SM2_3_26]
MIPGGGVREQGELPLWVERRLDKAIELYQGEYIITLSAGTVHKSPPLDSNKFPIFESVAGAKYLVNRGVPTQKVLIETCSYDTIGNAYFSRIIHVDPGKFKKLLIITSAFHMPRTEHIFKWIYGLDAPENSYVLAFEAVADDGMDAESLNARRQKEHRSLLALAALTDRIHTLQQLHQWMFSEHDAYAIGDRWRKGEQQGKALDTY